MGRPSKRSRVRDVGGPRSFRTHSLGGRRVMWQATVRNAWSLDQTSSRTPFTASSAVPQDGAQREKLVRRAHRESFTTLGTPLMTLHMLEAKFGKPTLMAADMPRVNVTEG